MKLYKLEQTPPKVREIAWKAQASADLPISGALRAGQEANGCLYGNRGGTGRLHVTEAYFRWPCRQSPHHDAPANHRTPLSDNVRQVECWFSHLSASLSKSKLDTGGAGVDGRETARPKLYGRLKADARD